LRIRIIPHYKQNTCEYERKPIFHSQIWKQKREKQNASPLGFFKKISRLLW
jgi:hypothetical protein